MLLRNCNKCHKILSQNQEEWGTEADGSRNSDYCCNCYQGGKINTLRIDESYLKERINKMREELKDLINKINRKK
jgi:hypothetical protein